MTAIYKFEHQEQEPEWSEEWVDAAGDRGEVFYITYDNNPSRTSNFLPVGCTHEVMLNIDPSRCRQRPGDTECERLFGIIPTRFNRTLTNGTTKSYVMVQALLPGREAYHSSVNIHDWLMCVNDLEVTWENLESILSAITSPKQIRLTLQQTIMENKQMILARQATGNPSLVQAINATNSQPEPQVSPPPFTVMYMTLDSGEEGVNDDLLYSFTSQQDLTSSKLVTLRGMFLTLCNVMVDVSQNPAQVSQIVCDGREMNVTYSQQGRELLTMAALSDDISAADLYSLTLSVSHVLSYCFGSLHNAMADSQNHPRVDLYFNLISHNLPVPQTVTSAQFSKHFDSFSTPVVLQIPSEAKLNIDNVLGDFEAADFGDMSDDYYDMQRAYTILGTVLFYKGYLVSSHLPTRDLEDISRFTSHYNLLHTSRSHVIGQLVMWQEVFPSRRYDNTEEDEDVDDIGYVEVFGRYFLLIVAHKHSIMTILLEAGGCAAKAMGHPVANSFYVNQAHQTLLQLEANDFSMICEARIQTTRPPLTSIENCLHGSKPPGPNTAKGILTRATNSAVDLVKKAGGSNKAKSKPDLSINQSTPGMTSMDLDLLVDAQSFDSNTSPPNTPGDFRRSRNRPSSLASTGSGDSNNSAQLYKQPSRGRLIASHSDSPKQEPLVSTSNGVTIQPNNSFMLTSGSENTLFSYMHIDNSLGVMLSPTVDELSVQGGNLHKQLISNFHSYVKQIKAVLNDQVKGNTVMNVNEYGVKFQVSSNDKKIGPQHYWVIGRKIKKPVERELYICHHSAVQENMVELAFKTNSSFTL